MNSFCKGQDIVLSENAVNTELCMVYVESYPLSEIFSYYFANPTLVFYRSALINFY
jgi:hypothetical protein